MSAVDVRVVRTAGDRRRFIALPYRLHRADPCWTPPLRRDVAKALSPRTNPFFEHGEAELYLAERDGRVVGRIAAIANRAHNEFHADRVGFFGFFECEDDEEAAGALLDRSSAWLRERGFEQARGPASFSTNDECGVVVHGFEFPGTVLTPHNPRYYPTLLESQGFAKAKDLFFLERACEELPERLQRGAELAARRNKVSLRKIDMSRYDEEIEHVKRLYNDAWDRNWGFVPMTESELDHLGRELKPIVVPEYVVFVEREGEVVGFAVALPDLNVALRANPSGRLLPGLLKILWAARKIDRVRIVLLGLPPRFRGKGIDAMLIQWIWQRAREKGVAWGEGGWILEDNAPMLNALTRVGFEHYRTLRMYERAL